MKRMMMRPGCCTLFLLTTLAPATAAVHSVHEVISSLAVVAHSAEQQQQLPAISKQPHIVQERRGCSSDRGVVTAAAASAHHSRLLQLRGGGGIGIKPIVAAKGITLLIGLQGVASYLFPASMLDGYQVHRTPLAKTLHRLTGLSWLIFAIGSHLLVVEQQPITKVVGVASVLYLLDGVRGLIVDDAKIFSPVREYMRLVLQSLLAYITLARQESSLASMATKAYPFGLLLAGLPLVVSPSTACSSVWGMSTTTTTSGDALIMRLMGFALTGLAAFVGSASFPTLSSSSSLQAVGWGHLASGTAFCVTTLCSNVGPPQMSKGPYYVWLMIYGVVLSALLPASASAY